MLRYRWLGGIGLALAAALALAGATVAQSAGPEAVVDEVTHELLEVLDERGEALSDDPVALYEALAPLIEPHIAYDRIGARILGPYWRKADAETRQRFIREFQRSLLRTYASRMEDYQGDVAIRILGSRPRDGGAQVGMEVDTGSGSPTRILYRLEQQDGAWKLVDVTAEGVSLIHNYREDFRSRLREKDLETVIDEMAARNRELGFE